MLLAWYPLSDILLHPAIMVTLGMIAVGVDHRLQPELASQMVDMMTTALKEQDPLLRTDPPRSPR
jgi:hypothetical protein